MSLQGCKLSLRYLFKKSHFLGSEDFFVCTGLSTLPVHCHHMNVLQDQDDPETFSGILQIVLV